MEDSSSNIVSVYPDPLIITQSRNSNYLESQLNLSNLTNEYIIFKIYNNQHDLYSAKPSTSFIPPKEKAVVTIKRFKKENLSSNTTNDKFLLLFYTINRVINDKEEAKEVFKSKLYNQESKQETMISILLKDNAHENDFLESTYTYNESILEDIGDDIIKGIKAYSDMNESLKKQSNSINQRIKEMENKIGILKTQKQLKSDKEKAMKDDKNKFKSDDGDFSKILMVLMVLLGLLVGANFAKMFN